MLNKKSLLKIKSRFSIVICSEFVIFKLNYILFNSNEDLHCLFVSYEAMSLIIMNYTGMFLIYQSIQFVKNFKFETYVDTYDVLFEVYVLKSLRVARFHANIKHQ